MLMLTLGAVALYLGADVADVADLLLAYVVLHGAIGMVAAWTWGVR